MRDASIVNLVLAANVENYVAVPAGMVSMELKPRTEADIRMAYNAGETATNYLTHNPDWWPAGLPYSLPTGKRIYFLCAIDNVLEIHFGLE